MKREANIALANIELSRELYTKDQRKSFFERLDVAKNEERIAYAALNFYRDNQPDKWKFWKSPPEAWLKVFNELYDNYIMAERLANKIRSSEPLLSEIYRHKIEPIVGDL